MSDERNWKMVREVADFPDGFDLEAAAVTTLEWWPDRKTVPTAARKIMKVARRVKREQES